MSMIAQPFVDMSDQPLLFPQVVQFPLHLSTFTWITALKGLMPIAFAQKQATLAQPTLAGHKNH